MLLLLIGTWNISLGVSLDTDLFLSRNSDGGSPYRGRICLTKLVQVVHPFLTIYIIPASDLLMARAFILDFFRQNHLRELICIQHR